MTGTRPFVLIACFALLLTACGGGGDDPAPAAAPGVLRALAVQGQPALGTGGNFGSFLLTPPLMDVAAGGWSAFVAPTTDVTKTSVLYVAQPDASLVEVFAVGEAVPAPGTGNITGFAGVWMCPGGIVLTAVTIGGGVPTFGVLSSVVAGGVATQKHDVIYDGGLLPAPLLGTLANLEAGTATKEDDGTFWFKGLESGSGFFHLFSVERDGTGLTLRAQRNAALPFDGNLLTIDAFNVDPTGTFYGFVASPVLPGPRRLLVRTAAPGALTEVVREGFVLPTGGGTLMNIFKGGRLNVFGNGEVVWMGQGTNAAPDDVFLWGNTTGAANVTVLARSGQAAPNTGGTLGVMNGMNQASGSVIPQFSSTVVGSPSGSTFGTFGILVKGQAPRLGTSHLMQADVGPLGATYVGLSPVNPPYTQLSANGSFLFANQLAGGLTAVLWMIPLSGVFALALENGAAPGGDTFGSFLGASAHVCADNAALFRAPLTAAGSGIFRRGP